MATITRSSSVQAPIEKVFEYVSDPLNLTEWMVGLMEVTDVTGSGADMHMRWKYKMAGIPFAGETQYLEYVANERTVSESKGGIPSKFTWTFSPDGNGTKLDLNVDYTIPVPVLGKLAEKLVLKRNEREADLWMENIKDRLEV